MQISVYSAKDKASWESAFQKIPPPNRSLFHTPSYVLSWADYEEGEPFCIHLWDEGVSFLYPFYQSPIPQKKGDSDISSAYGYGGMISSLASPPERKLAEANRLVDDWCRDNRVVAEFIREYPGLAPFRMAEHRRVRENLMFDYPANYENIAGQFKKRARRDIRTALKKGCRIEIDDQLDTLWAFETHYQDFCRDKDLKAVSFDHRYFEGVSRLLSKEAFLVNVIYDGTPVAMSLNFQFEGMIVYHLSASLPEYRFLLPNDLMLSGIIETGASNQCQSVFLGGGVGSGCQDSLYRFKEKYATRSMPVTIGTRVHYPDRYDALCASWDRQHPELAGTYKNYFLKYRVVV